MQLKRILIYFFAGFLLFRFAASGQSVDSIDTFVRFPSKFLTKIQSRTAGLDKQLTKQTEKYLSRVARQEARLQKKLYRLDSAAAKSLFSNSTQQYAVLARQIRQNTDGIPSKLNGEYLPYVDSLNSSLSFLRQHPQWLKSEKASRQLEQSIARWQQLQAKLQGADQVREFIRQRKEQIRQYLSKYSQLPAGLGKEYQGLNKNLYYYSQQLREYKTTLNDPDKWEKKALSLLRDVPAFQQFMKHNGQLAGLFNLPGDYGSPAALAGLQTRDQVLQQMQGQLASGGPEAMAALQQNLQSAQQQLDQFKDKIRRLGSGSGNIDLPDFKPNDQRTKTFLKRLEYGVNFQTAHNSYYFPTVTDLGLSLGYQLGHSNVVGIGASYKLGWGNGIRHVALSSQGVGLRLLFVDIKIKGSWSATGGWEYNYTTPFTSFQQVSYIERWTKSGLIGMSKTISMKNRVFKKTKLQLLWDFLSYQQVPRTQPVLFRIGYNFN